MVSSCVTTMNIKNVGSCVNNICFYGCIRYENIHTLEMISHQCTFYSCLSIMPKPNQIATKCNFEETSWSMVNEMMACIKWNQKVMNIFPHPPTEDVLSL